MKQPVGHRRTRAWVKRPRTNAHQRSSNPHNLRLRSTTTYRATLPSYEAARAPARMALKLLWASTRGLHLITVSREAGTLIPVIEAQGSIDSSSVRALLSAVHLAPANAPVIVDLSRVSEFQDTMVFALAQGLFHRPGKVSFRGLRRHQARILGYLGFRTSDKELEPMDVRELPGIGSPETLN
jgi:hypothetical protein